MAFVGKIKFICDLSQGDRYDRTSLFDDADPIRLLSVPHRRWSPSESHVSGSHGSIDASLFDQSDRAEEVFRKIVNDKMGLDKAKARNWKTYALEGGHYVMREQPQALVKML